MDRRDSKVMEMIANVLSNGGSSRLYKKMVDEKKEALQVGSFNFALEDYGAYINYAVPNAGTSLNVLLNDIDAEIKDLQTNLISQEDFEKIRNEFEINFVQENTKSLSIAENLANGYTFHHGNTNYLNEELELIRSVTREDIRNAARKYLNASARVVLYYLPGKNSN